MTAAAIAVDAGDLPLGGGLLALLRPALEALAPGGVVAVISSSPAVAQDLPSWCRFERHRYLGCAALPAAGPELFSTEMDSTEMVSTETFPFPPGVRLRHLIERGRFGVARPTSLAVPDEADTHTGFAPRGARVEPGGPPYPFTLTRRADAAPVEARALYDQAVAAQWDAARDIPWHTVQPLAPALDRAVAQVMTFLAENELAALYVPARFLPRLHPAYLETALFLSTQLADEARHIDVFLRRARAAGGPGMSSATTARSLLSLYRLEDFTEAAFLLSLLGEGTFLDLLRFVERFAPDAATAELARRARADEARHVHFGSAHVRHALAADPAGARRLEAAVRTRAVTLHGAGGVPAPIQDALTLLAAGSDEPRAVARGHEAFRELVRDMDEGRVKRLVHAGFTPAEAHAISELHTPNFM